MESWREELYHSELYHHGIKGMKWGVRRYQNPDGSLTELGKRRLGYKSNTTRRLEDNGNHRKSRKSAEYDRRIGNKNYNEAAYHRGKSAIKFLMMGPSGTQTYNMARAAGHSRARSFVKQFFDINLGRISENVASDAAMVPFTVGSIMTGNPLFAIGGTAASLATRYAVGNAVRDSGAELSLQQKGLRKAYIKGNSPSEKKKRKRQG